MRTSTKSLYACCVAVLLFLCLKSIAQPDTWHEKRPLGRVGPISRTGAASFSINGKGYTGTGATLGGTLDANDFWEYDPIAGTWSQKADFAGAARRDAVGFSIGDRGYIGTGATGRGVL